MSRLALFISLLISPATTLRVIIEEEASVGMEKVNATTSEQLCCAWRVELGKMACEIDIYNENRCKPGTSKWDLSAATEVCTNLGQGAKYFVAAKVPLMGHVAGAQRFLTENCVCETYKGSYKGRGVAKRYPNGAATCQSVGALGGTHCKLNGQPVSVCTCQPANMACSLEDMSMLFAPQVKQKGMMFNCGNPFDKNSANGHYMKAFVDMGMVSNDAEPVQKMIGSNAGEGWTFRDKYGGKALARILKKKYGGASRFCGAENELPEMPA